MNYFILCVDSLNNSFDLLESGNTIYFKYIFDNTDNFVEIRPDDLVIGYNKNFSTVKYLFKVVEFNNEDSFVFEKLLDVVTDYRIDDVNLIEVLETENICKLDQEEFNRYYSKLIHSLPNFDVEYEDKEDEEIPDNFKKFKRNIIYFGAPGTGKSFKLNQEKDKLLKGFEDNYERVTFHPDYSYSSFVGSYRPVQEYEDGKKIISYDYVAGPFMRVLGKALKNKSEPFLLLIEEINRANVAAVFGDIFQLLDRDKKHNSEYPINTSKEMREYLAKVTGKDTDNFEKIKIPSNMFIWATMNSADQGVFFMDAAFKRRWNFENIAIDEDDSEIYDDVFEFPNSNEPINWNILRKSINNFLLDKLEVKEDKLLGPFFISEIVTFESKLPNEDFEDSFKNKVLMYLYEDAAKSKPYLLFEGSSEKTYSKICKDFDEKGIDIFNKDILIEYNSIKEKHNPNEKEKDNNDDSSSN